MLFSPSLKFALGCKKVSTAYAKAMDSGYPLDWFVEPVDERCICEICGKVLRFPRSTPCGHVFCLHCLEFWIEYYGVCPKRCGEIELETTTSAGSLEKHIQSLQTRCKYHRHGCKSCISLEEKEKHEKRCIRRECKASNSKAVSSQQQDSYVEMASRGRADLQQAADTTCSAAVVSQVASRTFHLTRRAQESLGFVLVAGAKNSNGRAVNFSIKAVDPGSVAWKAGLQPGDKIVQLDNTALSILSQQEAVSRIKYNPCVTLTILRERVGSPSSLQSEHLYEEILYSDTPHNNTVQQEPEASGTSMGNCESAHHKRRPTKETRVRINTAPELLEQLKVPAAQGRHRSSTAAADPTAVEGRMLVEKVSADSGLSSGSSGSPPHNGRQTRALRHPHLPAAVSNTDFSKDAQGRHSYHNARELKKKLLKNAKAKGLSSSSIATRKTHVEDGYEVEEIFMEKNGTNQLGITLGYDAKASSLGSLFVCEVVANGLAAKDGRLRQGDIVRKVNGFEVYDPEEAVLLFLEQDQDITLTVARRIKSPSPPPSHFLKGSKSHASLLPSRARIAEGQLRRTDSCGSLDSHCTESVRPAQPQAPRSHSPTKPARAHSPSKLNHRRQLSEASRVHRRMSPSVSSGYSTGENPSIVTDSDPVFVPQVRSRPLKVSTSVGSADHNSCRHIQRSIGSLSDWPRSPPASWVPASSYRCNPRELVSTTHVVKNESLV